MVDKGQKDKPRERSKSLPRFALAMYLAQLNGYSLNKHTYPAAIAKYRAAVEELYALRQSGHIDADHCEVCREAYAAYRALLSQVQLPTDGQDSEEIPSKEVASENKRLMARLEKARDRVLALKHQGHVRESHCMTCASAKARVRLASNAVILGSSSAVMRVLNMFCDRRNGDQLRLDLFQEGLFTGVSQALSTYHPFYGTGRLCVQLKLDELGDEVWSEVTKGESGKSGTAFPSFARYAILHAMEHALCDRHYPAPFRIPYHVAQNRRLIGRVIATCEMRKGRRPSPEEVCNEITQVAPHMRGKVRPEHVRGFLLGDGVPLTLHREYMPGVKTIVGKINDILGDEDWSTATLQDLVADEAVLLEAEVGLSVYPFLVLIEKVLAEIVTFCWTHLSPEQAYFLLHRLGLMGGVKKEVNERATDMGVSRANEDYVWKTAMRHLASALGLTSEEIFLIRSAYTRLIRLYPHERRVRVGSLLLDEAEELSQTGNEASRKLTLEELWEKLEHASQKIVGPGHPFRLSAGSKPRTRKRQEEAILAIVGSSWQQIQVLLAVSYSTSQGVFVDDPCAYLHDQFGMEDREVIHVLTNLILRGWIKNLRHDRETEKRRFPKVQILWQEGMTVYPPDIPVVPFDSRPHKSVPRQEEAIKADQSQEVVYKMVDVNWDE